MSDTPEAAGAEAAPAVTVVPEGPSPEQLERRAGIKRILEALLFSSDKPIGTRQLAEAAGAADGHEARSLLKEMRDEYDEQGRAFALEEVAGGFQLMSRPEFAPYISRLHDSQQQESLSKAALETLAIVAYRQPITRAEIEDIRGVQCGPVLRGLVDRRLLAGDGPQRGAGPPAALRHHQPVPAGLRPQLPERAAEEAEARPAVSAAAGGGRRSGGARCAGRAI